MVRLEEREDEKPITAEKFQFQNGTIRRKIECIISIVLRLFQFQNGTIRSWGLTLRILLLEISIPKWYD